jgi:hypothetical protein
MLEAFGDFFVPLMKILDDLPNRAGQSGIVIRLFEHRYRDEISPHLFTSNQSGHIRWAHNVQWSREKLKHLGFIDSPAHGTWRFTEEGHQWLQDHPDATHLIGERPKIKRKMQPQRSISRDSSQTSDDYFGVLKEILEASLRPVLASTNFAFLRRANTLQIRLDGFPGCHYEFIVQRSGHEIALHFESSAQQSQERLRAFEPYLDELRQSLGMTVEAGDFQSRGWTQVKVEVPAQPLSTVLVKGYAELGSKFVTETFPILQKAYESRSKRRRLTARAGEHRFASSTHAILDNEIETIRAFLQGRSDMFPEDEKLCDWINFCYNFDLYAEGRELFALVSPDAVHPWY